MTLEEYQKISRKTAIYPIEFKILYPSVGLCGESGELAEKVKRWMRSGNLDKDGIIKEMGDVLWYLSALATDLDVSLEEVAHKNIEKLEDRSRRGVLTGNGDDR